jgi:O-antigen/teichoic acid export membrane protein
MIGVAFMSTRKQQLSVWARQVKLWFRFILSLLAFMFLFVIFISPLLLGTGYSSLTVDALLILIFVIIAFGVVVPIIYRVAGKQELEITHMLTVSFTCALLSVASLFVYAYGQTFWALVVGGLSFFYFSSYYLWQLYRSLRKLSSKTSSESDTHQLA